jgi:hypothetical protein
MLGRAQIDRKHVLRCIGLAENDESAAFLPTYKTHTPTTR